MTLPSLRLTNTLTRRKDAFVPIDPRHVRLYACGPTVYDFAHIGNARPVIVFDLLFRLLRHFADRGAFDGGQGETRVTYVRNITDVDDKINARAAADHPGLPLNEAIRRVTEGTARQFHDDIRALRVVMPDDLAASRHAMVEPRATDHVEAMRAIIDRLLASGHAYAADGNVLFHVPSMAGYGELSRRPLDEMEAGARVDVAPYKRSPLDFVLWKPSGPHEPGWPSPGGVPGLGRPGWHIECSAMAWQHLGERFDIHAGGLDLIFPHHENEIAQSRCAFGTPSMATVWLHNGFVQVSGEKMSKSLGNFVTIRDLLATSDFGGSRWHGAVLRFAMLGTHYRQPIDFTVERLTEARAQLGAMIDVARGRVPDPTAPPDELLEALADDLNTPLAVAALHRMLKAARGGRDPAAGQSLANALGFLGLWAGESAAEIVGAGQGASAREVEPLLDARAAARAARDWAASDRIRDELKAMGVVVKDNKDGTTTWEVAR